ncbi:uncharacterized protein PFL1_02832 [Pseudozyma flocculosa PF-1]|uniref:DUF726-domain-containing protein n=1 Tax=Pseudozyma flocculosa PF-1 TaxID=1277687 RepID=A0A061HAH2_9BASI|nr:uncharacterized protein PFL1_02832 [Pseudozyma flocculosa PF-1]EPQ29613.1 hypothetical protein PFL1_02832 [Pseudozyma flocculosa PF-1]
MSKATTSSSAFGFDDDDEWQSMPVESSAAAEDFVKPDSYANPGDLPYGDEDDDSSDPDDPRRFQSWPSRSARSASATALKAGSATTPGKAKKGWIRSRFASGSTASASAATASSSSAGPASGHHHQRAQSAATNATGRHLNIDDARGYDWRSKPAGTSSDSDDDDGGKEKGYTQLRLDEDDESEQLHAATEYLFQDGSGGINGRHDPYGEGTAATPLNQMKTTKQLLSEGQKIAYVGLCSLAAAGLVRMITRVPGKELNSAKESIESWKVKVMARLYQHMDIEASEQTMIESLATHGVLPTDLAPSLITTQTIQNPEFDPEALRERQEDEKEEKARQEREDAFKRDREEERAQAEQLVSGNAALSASDAPSAPQERGESASPTQDAPQQDSELSEDPSRYEADVAEASAPGPDAPVKESEEDGDIGAPAGNDIGPDVPEEADLGDLGDVGTSDEPAGKHDAPKSKRTILPATSQLDGDIGTSADADADAEVDLGDIGRPSSTTAANAQDGVPEPSPPSGGADADAGPATPKAGVAPLPTPRPGSIPDAPGTTATADKPILADPNTASQLGNAIDASAALQPAAARAPTASEGNTTTLGLTKQPEALEPPPGALDGVTTSISSADETITLDLRWTVLCDLFLVLTADSVYDARSRTLLETVASYLGLTWMDVTKFEKRITDALEIEEGVESLKDTGALDRRTQMARKKRIMMVGLATVGGGLVIGLSAGLLAPVIGAGVGAALGAVGIGGTSGFLGGVGGAALITTTGTVGGMSLGGRGMSRRTRSVKTFEFKSIHNNKRVNAIVTVPGFMSGPQDDVRLPFSVIDSIMGDVFSVLWEPDMMQEMGNALGILWNETLVQGVQQVLAATVAGAMFSALAWPLWLTKLGYLIDNPWSNALDRAKAAGYILADILSRRQLGVRPITLVGYSLGARAIFYCLVELARLKAYGIVQNVYIMGAPVTAKDEVWKEARSVVAGRFVSAFSRTDWILGYLHRAASGGLRSIAGLHPVERVQEIENVDVTHVVPGHLQYRALMPLVLSELGFKTTADYFDEPEDLTKVPERQVVREDSEYELKTVQTQSGGFGKIWKRKGRGDVSGSNSGTASPSRTTPGTPAGGRTSYEYDEYDDDDDLPPREEASPPPPPPPPPPASANKPASRGVHFDTDAILEELRESGIEVKELQSSLPPLVASTSHTATTPKKSSTSSSASLELPSPAFSSDRTPSPSAGKAASESRYQPPAPSASSSRRGSGADQGADAASQLVGGASASRGPAPYPRSFSASSSGLASPSYADFSLPAAPPLPDSAGGGGVSLSFASYDDDEIVAPAPVSEERSRSYGLSSETARELEAKFRGAVGPSLASASGPDGIADVAGGAGRGAGGSSNGWGSVPIAPWDRDVSTPGLEADVFGGGGGGPGSSIGAGLGGGGGGFASTLAPPSQTFGADAFKVKHSGAALDESFLAAATTAGAARREGSLSGPSSSSSSMQQPSNPGVADPWADNPWGGGGGGGY